MAKWSVIYAHGCTIKMIIIILGGIGSGKTLSTVREIITRKLPCFVNFNLDNMPGNIPVHRLKFEDIVQEYIHPDFPKKPRLKVNWDFWDAARTKYTDFNIFLDEISSVIHSRRSMTNQSIQMSNWVAQIRKICNDSESSNLFIISQTLSKIDRDFRDLAQVIIECFSMKHAGKVWIDQYLYDGIDNYIQRKTSYPHHVRFQGNPYFKFYHTSRLVKFSDAERFI